MTYDPDDQLEWTLVLNEIKSFIEVSVWSVARTLSIMDELTAGGQHCHRGGHEQHSARDLAPT